MDETAFASKRGKGTWLHEELAKVATTVVGVDNSSVVPEQGLRTGERSIIHHGDVHDLEDFLNRHAVVPDVVVAGELIEHVPNPLALLQALATTPSLRGKTLILTTPNATALHN
ncbi:MAG TPA: methyltransferase domain-containing protein, partial [Steroidobacteraceae bacterium]|nr:methyltransferase domain-containing protein [Steroidobacteraceae bacterium]